MAKQHSRPPVRIEMTELGGAVAARRISCGLVESLRSNGRPGPPARRFPPPIRIVAKSMLSEPDRWFHLRNSAQSPAADTYVGITVAIEVSRRPVPTTSQQTGIFPTWPGYPPAAR